MNAVCPGYVATPMMERAADPHGVAGRARRGRFGNTPARNGRGLVRDRLRALRRGRADIWADLAAWCGEESHHDVILFAPRVPRRGCSPQPHIRATQRY